MRQRTLLLGFLMALMMPASVHGQDAKPIRLALLSPLQLVGEDQAVRGLRLSLLYGKNTDLSGLDISLVGHTTGDFVGLQVGLVGMADGDFKGWQSNVVNIVAGDFEGYQQGLCRNDPRGDSGRGRPSSGSTPRSSGPAGFLVAA